MGKISAVYCDSAEQTIINTFRSKTNYSIKNSIKNKIIDRIRCENILLGDLALYLVAGECEDLEEGLENAIWNEEVENERLDDGTSNIDILDAFEYSFERNIKRLVRR